MTTMLDVLAALSPAYASGNGTTQGINSHTLANGQGLAAAAAPLVQSGLQTYAPVPTYNASTQMGVYVGGWKPTQLSGIH